MNLEQKIDRVLTEYNFDRMSFNEAKQELLNLHSVSHQRELLKAFQKHYEKTLRDDYIYDDDIESFIKDFNCG